MGRSYSKPVINTSECKLTIHQNEQNAAVRKLLNEGQHEVALEWIENTLQEEPNHIEALFLLGKIKQKEKKNQQALFNFNKVVTLYPQHHEAHLSLAVLFNEEKKFEQALKHIDKAGNNHLYTTKILEQKSIILTNLKRHNEALLTLKKIIESGDATHSTWENLGYTYASLCKIKEALSCYKKAITLTDNNEHAYNNFLVFLHYDPETPRAEIINYYKQWEKIYAKGIIHKNPNPPKIKNKKIRIGMISDGFRAHPVGQMTVSALESIPKNEIELYLYSTNQKEDDITYRLKRASKKWISIEQLSYEELATQLIDDKIDILFDLCGHNAGYRIKTMAMKPAPILVKWVGGLIDTTGLSTMDYLLSDSIETPNSEDKFYTEKLIRMPDDYICYEPPVYTPDITLPPAIRNGYITLGCFNNPTKINNIVLSKWAKIMHSLPNSRLYLKGFRLDIAEVIKSIKKTFSEKGISDNRILIEGPSTHDKLLHSYNKVDIALDPWPYSGGLTTCEAMFMGVPVVTLPGPTFAGRHSATHLTNAGMPYLVAESWEHYHDLVVMLANDIDNLANIRQHLRSALLESPVCDSKRFARNFSNAMRAIWQRHCEGKQPAALTLDKVGNARFEDEAEPVQLQLPEKPVLVEDDDFHFRFNGKIVVVDHGAEFTYSESFHSLHKLGATKTICIDPGSRVNNAQQLANTGDFHHFPMTVLGDGSQKSLFVTIDPANTSTLPFNSREDFPEELKKGHEVLAQLPINTLRLDDVEGLETIDLLALDNNHDILSILANSTKKLANTLIVQVKTNLNLIHNKECNFDAISSSLMECGFIFHDFTNKKYIKSSSNINTPDILLNADAIFLPSASKLNKLSKNSIFKLAFFSHYSLNSPDLCTKILNLSDPKLAKKYQSKNNFFSTTKNYSDNNTNLNINTKKNTVFTNNGSFNWEIEEMISVVDIGANPIDGEPPYFNLLKDNKVKVTGFEPQKEALEKLIQMKSENETYLPYAVGDGNEATLYICHASGMTSTLKPNFEVLNQFQGYPQWAKVKKEEKIKTVRLDDLSELTEIDWLKIDIQGGELSVFKNAEKKLKNTLIIQTEVNFIQLYENQPLFSEIDQWMREHGFTLHTLLEERKRLYAPMVINNQVHNGINQLTTADAIYIKNERNIAKLTTKQKKKMAYILHHAYGSYDISLKILLTTPNFDEHAYIISLTSKDTVENETISSKIDSLLKQKEIP